MDAAQMAQMITWLDEELRKDKTLIGELRDLIQKQAVELADQRKRNEELLGRVTRLQTELAHMSTMDQAIQQIKNELAAVLHDVREELRRSDQQALQARQLEREAEAKMLVEMGQRVERLLALEDRFLALSTEHQRQNEAMLGLRQRLDGVDKELLRRGDQARLAEDEHKRELGRMDAMQQAVDGLRSQAESFAARMQYVERWAQSTGERTAELQAFRADMQRLQAEMQEAQRRGEQRIEKQIRDWNTITEATRRDLDMWANQLRIFSEQHERTKKALASMQDLAKGLRVAQEEARQVLELGLDKQRRELREWQGEDEKRWTRYLSQWEYRWEEQRKRDEGLAARIESVEAELKAAQQEVQQMRTMLLEEAAAARATAAELWRLQLDYLQRQADIVRATAEKIQGRLDSRTRAAPEEPTL